MSKSKAQRLEEKQTRELAILVDGATRIFCGICDCAKVVLPFVFIYYCAREFAGKSTQVDMVVKAITDLKADRAFAFLFGAGGCTWGACERYFRKKKTAALARRTANTEKLLDSRRSSSGLKPSGETRKEDTL